MLTKLIVVLVGVLGAVALLVGLSALFAWPVQLLWNGVAVDAVDGLNRISFLQAWGLSFLTGLLFKSNK